VTGSEYILDREPDLAAARYAAFAAVLDPVSLRHVAALGLPPGARCWELGAGGLSLASQLAGQVGPNGSVLATDISVAAMSNPPARVEVRQHNVVTDPLPEESFDLIHARLVLGHLPERVDVLRRIVTRLRPGGWLLIEDADTELQPLVCPEAAGPDQELANRIKDRFRSLLASRGGSRAFGRTLPRLLRASGLCDVAADVYFPLATADANRLEALTIRSVHYRLIAETDVSASELDHYLWVLDNTVIDVAMPPLVSTWGRTDSVTT